MKTLKIGAEIVRKKDEEAEELVGSGKAKYCPKSEYKKLHGKKAAQVSTKKAEKEVTSEPKVKKGRVGSVEAEAKYREKKSQRA